MKTRWPKILSEIYQEAGYSERAVCLIQSFESKHSEAEKLLDTYRFVQPDDKLFSERSLEIIWILHNMFQELEAHSNTIYRLQKQLSRFVHMIFKNDNEENVPAADFYSEEPLY